MVGVANLDLELSRLDAAGIDHGPATDASTVRLAQLEDPDGNRFMLTEPLPT